MTSYDRSLATSRRSVDATNVGAEHLAPQFRLASRDRFDWARDLVDCLDDAGLCAFSTWEHDPPTVSVSAHVVGSDPSSARTVWCLPRPDLDDLYWQWPLPGYRSRALIGSWFEPLCPIVDPANAAAHLIGAVHFDRVHRMNEPPLSAD
ncbi:hypothetical protein [Actinomadura chibensis]|uniref:Uncharacterized protein n=1 Tax=Actinomadura chibensis TaxID=392828 RepID=A0A5D0N8N4_9ACTN|nr:hypothetical protein [Actinomadura chibensis]TYB40790.1 hypothetical protein FXF69_37845 [Actinomadura chibensis]